MSSRGCLIDLDHARVGEKIQDILVPKVEQPAQWAMAAVELQYTLDCITHTVIMKLGDVPKFQVQEDIVL